MWERRTKTIVLGYTQIHPHTPRDLTLLSKNNSRGCTYHPGGVDEKNN